MSDTPIISIAIIAVAVILVVAIIAIALVLLKKSKSPGNNTDHDLLTPAFGSHDFAPKQATGGVYATPVQGRTTNIRIENQNNPSESWEFNLSTEIFAGRKEDCQIYVNEKSISRRQFKIYFTNVVTIVNLSQTNVTLLNGSKFIAPAELKQGDKIKCGRVTLLVTEIFSHRDKSGINMQTEFANV